MRKISQVLPELLVNRLLLDCYATLMIINQGMNQANDNGNDNNNDKDRSGKHKDNENDNE